MCAEKVVETQRKMELQGRRVDVFDSIAEDHIEEEWKLLEKRERDAQAELNKRRISRRGGGRKKKRGSRDVAQERTGVSSARKI